MFRVDDRRLLLACLVLFSACPALAQPPRTDAHGDPLPPGALTRLGTTRLRPPNPAIIALAFSPDDRALTSVGRDGDVRVWDPASGKQLRVFAGPDGLTRARFSPNARLVALSPRDTTVAVWDTAAGAERFRLPIKAERFEFVGDKLLWTLEGDGTARWWDTSTGKEVRRGAKLPPGDFALAPDGTLAIRSREEGPSVLLTMPEGKEVRTVGRQQKYEFLWYGFSADGRLVAEVRTAGAVRILDGRTGEEVRRLDRRRPPREYPRRGLHGESELDEVGLAQIVFSPDGKFLAVGCHDSPVRLWHLATGRERLLLLGGGRTASALAFSHDGKLLASSGFRHGIRLWDVATGEERRPVGGHSDEITRVAFSPDGRHVVTSSRDRAARVWDAETGKEVHRAAGSDFSRAGIHFSGGGARVTLAAGGLLEERDTASGRLHREFVGMEGWIQAVTLSADGRSAATLNRRWAVELRDARTGKRLRSLAGDFTQPRSWLELARHHPTLLAFSPDSRLLAAAPLRSRAVVWDVASGKCLHEFSVVHNPFYSLEFSADDFTLAAAGVNGTQLWDLRAGKELASPFPEGTAAARSAAFARDGRTLALGGPDGKVTLWEWATRRQRGRLTGHAEAVFALAFSPDGTRLATGSRDTTALIWDLTGSTPTAPPTEAELTRLWETLAGADAEAAYRAVSRLAAAPEKTVAFLRTRLRPLAPPSAKQTERRIADLGARRFTVRSAAFGELLRLPEPTVPALRKALAAGPSLEVRRRIEQLLREVDGPVVAAERLRDVRAVEVLERIATAEARRLLGELARGAPEALLTREARASVRRLAGGG